MNPDSHWEKQLRAAIKYFWSTRETQAQKQGSVSGSKDAGARSAVTGGAQMNGFIDLVRDLLCENGLPKANVYCEKAIELPGWYRPEKKWDLLVVSDGKLLAGIEFKSQVGSFGNNYNNRTEEAIGSATDIWAAYREGAFKPSARPWLGYLMLLEEATRSIAPVRAREPHFKVFPEFKVMWNVLVATEETLISLISLIDILTRVFPSSTYLIIPDDATSDPFTLP